MVKILTVAPSHDPVISPEEINTILLGSSWFRALPDYLIEQMVSRATLYQYENGEIIHYRGDESLGLYAVITGSVKVSSVSADGRECIFRYLSPGNWFGEIGMIDKSTRTHDARAIGKTILLTLKPRDVEFLLQNYPILHRFLALLCKRRLSTVWQILIFLRG